MLFTLSCLIEDRFSLVHTSNHSRIRRLSIYPNGIQYTSLNGHLRTASFIKIDWYWDYSTNYDVENFQKPVRHAYLPLNVSILKKIFAQQRQMSRNETSIEAQKFTTLKYFHESWLLNEFMRTKGQVLLSSIWWMFWIRAYCIVV